MAAENAIEIKDVTKIYRLYEQPIDRLKESLNIGKKQYHPGFLCPQQDFFFRGKGTDRRNHRNERFGQIDHIKDYYRSPDADIGRGDGERQDIGPSGAGSRF